MAAIKPLHLARNLEELNKRVTSEKETSSSSIKVLCRIADKLLLKGKDAELEGDQEVAYVMYMRFMDLYQHISSIKRDRAEAHKLLPNSKVKSALTKAEQLSKSLKERYLEAQEGPKELDKGQHSRLEVEESGTSEAGSRPGNTGELLLPSSSSQPSQSGTGQPSSDQLGSIAAPDLYQLLTQHPDQVLVLDCRPRSEFNSSHPDTKKFPQWLCIPEELVEAGLSDKTVLSFLPGRAKNRWKGRGSVDHVVLVDDSSSLETLSRTTPSAGTPGTALVCLRDALCKFDASTSLKSSPRVLDGGYSKWYLTYAVTCTGKYTRKKNIEQEEEHQGAGLTNGGLDYPSFPTLEEPSVSTDEGTALPQTSIVIDPDPSTATVSHFDSNRGNGTSSDLHPSYHDPNLHPGYNYSSSSSSPASQISGRGQLSGESSYQPQIMPTQGEGFFPAGIVGPTLPPAPPVPLNLAAETGLMAPSLLSDQDLFTDYPELRRQDNEDEDDQEVEQEAETAGYGVMDDNVRSVGNPQQDGRPQLPQHYAPQAPSGQQNPLGHQHQSPQVSQTISQPHMNTMQSNSPQGYPPHSQPPQICPLQAHPLQAPHIQSQNPQTFSPQSYPPQPQLPLSQNHQSQPQPPQPQPPQSFPPQTSTVHPQSTLPPLRYSQPHPPNSQLPQPIQHQPPYPQSHPSQFQPPQHQQSQPLQPHPPQHQFPQSQPLQTQPTQPQTPETQLLQPQPPQTRPQPPQTRPQPLQTQSQPPQTQPQPPQTLPQPPQTQPQPPQTQPHSHLPQPRLSQTQPPQPPHSQPSQPEPPQMGIGQSCLPQEGTPQQPLSTPSSQPPQISPVPVPPSQPSQPSSDVASEREMIMELRRALEAELQLAREQREEGARQLAKGRAELEAQKQEHQLKAEEERKEFAMMKKKYEEGLQFMAAEKQRYLMDQQAQQELVKQQQKNQGSSQTTPQGWGNRAMAVSENMPRGWEKRLDRQTGRYYYVDHTTQTTHWNPPTQLINYQMKMQEEAQRQQQQQQQLQQQQQQQQQQLQQQQQIQQQQKQQDLMRQREEAQRKQQQEAARLQEDQGRRGQQVPGSSGVPEAPSSKPPLPVSEEKPSSAVTVPAVDRRNKPSGQIQPLVDRSKKPASLWTDYQMQIKNANLQAVLGREGSHVLRTGLRNLGNTCYMNATLQCLCHTVAIMPYFISLKFKAEINYNNPLGHKGEVAKEFAWLAQSLWCGKYRSVSPRDFKGMVDVCIPAMKGNGQQDAQEFLAFLMNELHEDLNRVQERIYIPEQEGRGNEREQATLAWKNHIKRNDSVIVRHFQGLYRSTVVCSCGKRSTTFEPFMYLSLPIPPGEGSHSLYECIKLFSRPEKVPWSCVKCKQTSGATKTIEIWRLPDILLVGISRFSYSGAWKDKRQNYIDYPCGSSRLDLSKYVVGERPRNYVLYAVANHFGTLSGGHYTACCLNPYDSVYYNFDDQDVKKASSSQVKSVAGYLLFYTSLPHRPPQFK